MMYEKTSGNAQKLPMNTTANAAFFDTPCPPQLSVQDSSSRENILHMASPCVKQKLLHELHAWMMNLALKRN